MSLVKFPCTRLRFIQIFNSNSRAVISPLCQHYFTMNIESNISLAHPSSMLKSKSSSSSSMNDAYTLLALSIEEAKTWTPKIIFRSTQLKFGDNNTCTINKYNTSSDVDIVKLLSLPSTPDFNYAKELQFPPGTIFKFEGFNGLEQKEKLKNHIISTAQQNGTSLFVYQSQKSRSDLRKHLFVFGCFHHKCNTTSSKMEFHNDQLQATNTIVVREHQLTSIKGRSRCANNSYANTTQQSIAEEGPVRKSTRKRPINNESRCMFKFSIICASTDDNWYLMSYQPRSNGTTFHSNHHKVSPYHLCTHLKSIDDTIRIKVKELIENGLRNNMIVNNLKSAHSVDINANQIQNIREDSINEVLNVDEKNYKSSVDRLLSLFNKMSDVSFVYMMHTITSGFVTFHKTKGECNPQKINNQNDKDSYGNLTNEDTNCIETWRKQLKIGDEDKILVAFAWCHDDEKRKMLMFPEFWATDMTFGLNIERRQLLTVAGVDGNCKSFTGLRVWMPSKQRVAYQWALSTALPVLVGETTCLRNKVININKGFTTNVWRKIGK